MIPRLRVARQVADDPVADEHVVGVAVQALVSAGVVMGTGVVACLVVAPKPVVVDDGLSWFGVTRSTLLPFALTMLTTAALLLRASRELLQVPALRPLGPALGACAAFLPLLVATPFTLSPVVEDAHETVGSALFVVQLLAVAWLWRRTRDRLVGLLLLLQFGAGVVCAASLPDLVPAMLQAQVAFQAAFTAATVRGVLLIGARGADGSERTEAASGRSPV